MPVRRFGPLVMVAAAMLAGCAANGVPSPAMDSDRFLRYADEPVRDIRYRNFVEWHPLNRDWMMLRFENNRYYVLEVYEPCVSDLREANNVGLVGSVPDRLNIFNHIRVGGRTCRIKTMRPIDHEAFRNDPEAPDGLFSGSSGTE